YTFDIGVFPFLTIFATLIFFSADWPTQFWQWLTAKKDLIKARYADRASRPSLDGQFSRWGLVLAIIFLVCQVIMPLRPAFYPGVSSWTREGDLFSWHMKLNDHKLGKAVFTIYSPSANKTWMVDNSKRSMDGKKAFELATHPEYIVQFAHYLQKKWERDG